MTLTLVYGGTFDPVHLGHIQVARQLLTLFGDATISLVPCRHPAHRDLPHAGPDDRLQMLQLALAGKKDIKVDDCELRREGTSYSVDTLRYYRRRLGSRAPLAFVMGMDSWDALPTWHQWRHLVDQAHLVIVSRPGYPHRLEGELKEFSAGRVAESAGELLKQPAGLIYFADLPESDVSATALREMLRRGEDVSAMLPAGVANYINKRQLYEAGAVSTEK